MVSAEFPFERAGIGCVVKIDAGQPCDLRWVLRSPVKSDEIRCGHGQDAGLDQLAGDQRPTRWFAEPHRQIETVCDQVADMVAHDELDANVRVTIEEGYH